MFLFVFFFFETFLDSFGLRLKSFTTILITEQQQQQTQTVDELDVDGYPSRGLKKIISFAEGCNLLLYLMLSIRQAWTRLPRVLLRARFSRTTFWTLSSSSSHHITSCCVALRHTRHVTCSVDYFFKNMSFTSSWLGVQKYNKLFLLHPMALQITFRCIDVFG